MLNLPSIGEVGPIPTILISQFTGQPRSFFDQAALRELADSIAAEGQRTPAWVMPVTHGKFELIAGERRWRACQLAGIQTLLCEVRARRSATEQYIDSVMENFGRKDCTVLEAATAVRNVIHMKFGGSIKHGDQVNEAIAKVFARSPAWVQQMRSIMRLHPRVLALLEPPQKLPTQVALTLTNLRPELQVQLAEDIAHKGMRLRTALAYVRNSVTDTARVSHRGSASRKRRGSDDWGILTRFLSSIGEQAQAVISMPHENMRAIFTHRDPKDLKTVQAVLRKRVGQLQELDNILGAL